MLPQFRGLDSKRLLSSDQSEQLYSLRSGARSQPSVAKVRVKEAQPNGDHEGFYMFGLVIIMIEKQAHTPVQQAVPGQFPARLEWSG